MSDKEHRILILDDHVEMAQAVGELLEFEGHHVRVVHDGPSAIAAFREEKFDLAFFDIRMPGMNGVEAFLAVKSEFPQASIVMMSGFADEELIKLALANGARGLLGKPFEPDDLFAKIANARASSPAAPALQPN